MEDQLFALEGTVINTTTKERESGGMSGHVEVPQDDVSQTVPVALVLRDEELDGLFDRNTRFPAVDQSFHFLNAHMRPAK